MLTPAVLILATSASTGCRTCVDSSYCPGVAMSARFRSDSDSLKGGTATVCWRDLCSTATLPGAGFVGPLRDYGDARDELRSEKDGTWVLGFRPYLANGDAFELLIADGDRYRFEVRDRNGVVLVDAERTATYTRTGRAASDCYQGLCLSTSMLFEGVR